MAVPIVTLVVVGAILVVLTVSGHRRQTARTPEARRWQRTMLVTSIVPIAFVFLASAGGIAIAGKAVADGVWELAGLAGTVGFVFLILGAVLVRQRLRQLRQLDGQG